MTNVQVTLSCPHCGGKKTAEIPRALRYWFIAHFVIDMVFAIPLLLLPAWFLGMMGFEMSNLLLARIIGAALLAIGGVSFVMHKEDVSVYIAMLQLKLLWSGGVIVSLVVSLNETALMAQWFLLGIFVSFFSIWGYFFRLLRKQS